MPVYAARHPEHVRSIVLSGAYPISFDLWGRDLLRGARRRSSSSAGARLRARAARAHDLGRLAQRLRRHPVPFTAPTADGPVRLTLGEPELAMVTYGRGTRRVYGLLPAAVDAALDDDYAPLKRLAAERASGRPRSSRSTRRS